MDGLFCSLSFIAAFLNNSRTRPVGFFLRLFHPFVGNVISGELGNAYYIKTSESVIATLAATQHGMKTDHTMRYTFQARTPYGPGRILDCGPNQGKVYVYVGASSVCSEVESKVWAASHFGDFLHDSVRDSSKSSRSDFRHVRSSDIGR